MLFPHLLFRQAGLNPADVANLCKVSRITGWRWLKGSSRQGTPGAGVNLFLRDRVARVAANVTAAVEAGALPDEQLDLLAPPARAAKIKSILKQHRTTK